MKTIIVFGVFVADLCFFSKKIPLTGQTIIGNNHIIGPGGKGSNQAISAARLGADVQFITKIGKDNKLSVSQILGEPSFKGSLGDNSYYYMGTLKSKVAVLESK